MGGPHDHHSIAVMRTPHTCMESSTRPSEQWIAYGYLATCNANSCNNLRALVATHRHTHTCIPWTFTLATWLGMACSPRPWEPRTDPGYRYRTRVHSGLQYRTRVLSTSTWCVVVEYRYRNTYCNMPYRLGFLYRYTCTRRLASVHCNTGNRCCIAIYCNINTRTRYTSMDVY